MFQGSLYSAFPDQWPSLSSWDPLAASIQETTPISSETREGLFLRAAARTEKQAVYSNRQRVIEYLGSEGL